ncbi:MULTISPECIES: hypothetical protein [Kosakonia]|uniref:hypothetical protein n=1 Tax=Kosakonia TaxID=1330547 RepID=UPI0009E27C2A|nr:MULTISPECIES: hypothetical protein [Kosakonia]RCW95887.1 hypothetical protein DFO56_11357 [Kosakonia sp. AG348]
MTALSKRDQLNFILHKLIPAIVEEGMTIKTRHDGEVTFKATDPAVMEFIDATRTRISNQLQRAAAPSSPYGA